VLAWRTFGPEAQQAAFDQVATDLALGDVTRTAEETATAAARPTPTISPVWRDKVSGIWIDNELNAEYTIDLDAGTIDSVINGVSGSDMGLSLEFDHEEGKTVYVKFMGRPDGDSIDTFRFLNDDTMVWGNSEGHEHTTLIRK